MSFDVTSFLMGKASGGGGGGGNAFAKYRAPTSADGENGEYWFELMNYSPGIISGDFSGNASTPNAGWEFEVTEEVSLVGLRGKARNSYTGTLKFGTTSEKLAEKSVDLVAGEWVSVRLDDPITLSPNTRYVVMLYGQASTLSYNSRGFVSINSKVVYKHARYTNYATEWPGNTENSNVYSADVMLGTDPPYPINKQYYKAAGTWSEVT